MLWLGIYIILINSFASYGQKEIVIENKSLKVTISTKGAELQSIYHRKTKSEILWVGDSAYWGSRSPVMFPVNVRFKDDKYIYNAVSYEMPRMGLAAINTFSALPENESQKAVLAFESSEQTMKYYPFHFYLELSYELLNNELINSFKIENRGKDTMYFALGGHPGFNCPLKNGLERADYQYVFPEKINVDRIEIVNSLWQGNQIPFLRNEIRFQLNDSRIPNGGMFLQNLKNRQIGVAQKGKAPFVTVDLGDFPNVNLWSPPGMPFACIEPMVSHHDIQNSPLAIERKTHLEKLAPKEIKTYKYTIIVDGNKNR